jgi:hydrogenase nickel incorporation protein HypA/HybF
MHELSVALNIVETATKIARDAGAERVTKVRVRIGELAGVAPDALKFSYEVAVAETLLVGSQLIVEVIPVRVHCPCCDREFALREFTRLECPICETPTGDLRSGRELVIESIEVI